MGTDCKVRFRSYEQVSQIAASLRDRLGIDNLYNFNITKQLERMNGKRFGSAGELTFDKYNDGKELAFVTYEPLVLHVDSDIWEEANFGEPMARFILAHEIGHVVMHAHYRQAFSFDEERGIKFVQPEERAETQAHWFAAKFLVPARLICDGMSDLDICNEFGFPSEYLRLVRK